MIAHTTSSIRRLCRWLEHADSVPEQPSDLTRELLERFLAHVRACPDTGESRKRTIIVDLRVFLDDVRMHGWEPELSVSAVYHRDEVPKNPKCCRATSTSS